MTEQEHDAALDALIGWFESQPLPERRPYVSRYAGARTLQQRSLRQTLQVESSYLLCQRPRNCLAHIKSWVVLPNLSSMSRPL
jgi:hypothetical protein